MKKILRTAVASAVDGNVWKKFSSPTVARGKAVFPQKESEQEKLGVRWDYDKEITTDGKVYNKFQLQANSGKVPSTIKKWREANGDHAVMADVLVKKGGTKEDVEKGLTDGIDKVK